MSESAYEPNGLNNNVSEETQLTGKKLNSLGKKDQRDEPKKTTPSTANGGHDKETRNGGSNPNQAEPTTDESSGGEEPVGRCRGFCCSIHGIIIAILSLISIGLLARCLSACPARPSCPKYWLTYEGKCYHFSDAEGTWNSSQNNCTLYGASLVLVDTPEEMAFVRRYKSRTDYWIGLRREAVEEPWKWPNGSVFNSLFKIGSDGLCAYLNDEDASSTWCHTRRNFICSKFLHAP